MSSNLDRVKALLKNFDLDSDDIDVYICLLRKGVSPASAVSKTTNIPRSTVYRILDNLEEKGLVSTTRGSRGDLFKANSYKQLEILLNQKKSKLDMMESSLKDVYKELAGLVDADVSSSKILTYDGLEGLKTVNWNSTRAEGILRVIEASNDMGVFLDFDFSERVRMEYVKKGLEESRQLTNFTEISPWTNIEDFVEIWEAKHISPERFPIDVEVVIYNNIVTIYKYQNDEFMCVEIYNESLANMQKKYYDLLWEESKPLKKLDSRGKAVLE
jgi:predicted transcriptional regulator